MSSSCNHQGLIHIYLCSSYSVYGPGGVDMNITLHIYIYSHTAEVSMVYVPTFD